MALLEGGSPGYSRDVLIAGQRMVWLLEIEFAGTVWRWSTYPLTVDGYQFDGGLGALSLTNALGIVSDASRDRSVPLEVLWPSPGVALLIQRGHDLAAAKAQLSLLIDGQPYESRVVVIQGLLSQPEYEAADQPVSFTITEQPLDDLAKVIPPSFQIDATTWPTAPESSNSQRYPFPIFNPDSTRTNGVLSPAYALTYSSATNTVGSLIISGFEVVATSVSIGVWVDHDLKTVSLPVQALTDGLGRTVWGVDISAQTTDFTQASDWFVYDWGLGGIRSPYGGVKPITTAGELMRFLADLSSVRVDRARFASAAALLSWPVEGWIDDDVGPLEYLIDRLLPVLPVSLVSGPSGLSPVVWRYDAKREDAVETFVNGINCVRIGAVTYQSKPSELVQRIALRWGYDAHTREYTRQTVLEPFDTSGDGRSHSSAFVRAAATRYTDNDPKKWRTYEQESELIGSEITASRFLAWKIRQLGYSPRLVDYDTGLEFAWLEVGAVVLLTDSELYFSGIPALVVGKTFSDTTVLQFQLQILDDLASSQSVGPSLDQNNLSTWVPGGN